MKKLLILLFSILVAFNSYGEWVLYGKNVDGETHYIDFDTIKEHKGYVYWWHMSNYIKPNEFGYMSGELYIQGDCGINRMKYLSYSHSKQPMGERGETNNPPNPEWVYPSPGGSSDYELDLVCDYVK